MCGIKKRKNFFYLITYFLLFALPFILLPEPFLLFAQQIEEGERLLKEGIEAIKQGAYDVAITRLEQAIPILKDKDKLADAFFYLGIAYFAFKRIDKVKQLMNEILRLKPKMRLDTELSPKEYLALWEEVKKETLATLTIETIPAEADIYLDGELMGKSPLEITNLFPAERSLRLIKEDYEVKEELITLDPGLEKKVEIRLIKMPPKITATPSEKKPEVKKSRAWIWIIIAAAAAGTAIFFLTKGKKKETGKGEVVTGNGNISAKSEPKGALIYLDGQSTNKRTPHTITVVSSGNHSIKLVLSGFDDWSSPIQVLTNQTATVNAELSSSFYEIIHIPAGEFLMGCNYGDSDERPTHLVYISSFYIDKYEVTNEQYKGFIDATNHGAPPYWNNKEYPSGKAKHPVVRITREDMLAYCRWIGKRLPTEAEWEKAARGGLEQMDYPWGNGISCAQANIQNCIGGARSVGSYQPNGYGLYDIAGNVWEAVKDWLDSQYYSYSPYNNPQGPSSGTYRVARGGSWKDSSWSARCANRSLLDPNSSLYTSVGFRCAKD